MSNKPKINRILLAVSFLMIIALAVLVLPRISEKRSVSADTNSANITMRKTSKTYHYGNMEIMKFTIEYPEVKGAAAKINVEIAAQVAAYVKEAEKTYQKAIEVYEEAIQEGYPFYPWEAYIKYQITNNTNGLLSLYVDDYIYSGGAHGGTVRTSATWDLAKGTQRTLDSFFKLNADYRNLVLGIILRQAQHNLEQDPDTMYFDDYQDLIKKNFNPQSFYLTPNGLVIYYQQYEVGPYAAGIIEFTIPYEQIR